MLEVKNVHKSYKHLNNTLEILKGITIDIQQGEFVSIVGPSGAGKSTLLHIMGGLDNPSKGNIFVEGEDIYKLNDSKRAKFRNVKVGFVFQSYHLLPEFTALENVLLPALIKGEEKNFKRCEEYAMEVLISVGLKDRVKHKPNELSGGEQQRVAIARSLVNKPKIIFCDEPTGNLDSASGKSIIEVLRKLNKENKQTLVIVTHDESIAALSSRQVHMRDGRLI